LNTTGLDNDAETAEVKEWQSSMRDFIKQTGLQRQPVRKNIIISGGTSLVSQVSKTPALMKSYPETSIKQSGNNNMSPCAYMPWCFSGKTVHLEV
jgi:hypothetical protein